MTCPLDSTWLTRHPLEVPREVAATRERLANRMVGARTVASESIAVERVDEPTPPVIAEWVLRQAKHAHADLVVEDIRVHIDWLAGSNGGGPGMVFREVQVFANEVLVARAHVFGCLGGNGNSFPAIGRLSPTLAIRVDSFATNHVEVLNLRDPRSS